MKMGLYVIALLSLLNTTIVSSAELKPQDCSHCLPIGRMLLEIQASGNTRLLESLEKQILTSSSISESDRDHLKAMFDSTRREIKIPGNEGAIRSSRTSPHAFVVELNESLEGKAITPARLAEGIPHGDTEFEHCQRVIHFANLRNDIHAIENLRKELPKFTGLTEAQRKSIEEAASRFGVEKSTLVGTSSGLAKEVPHGDTEFEHCQRVIHFANLRNDVHAIENLKKELPKFTGLTEAQRKSIEEAASRSTVIETRRYSTAQQLNQVPRQVELTLTQNLTPFVATSNAPSQGGTSANAEAILPVGAENLFSSDYRRIRQRYLDYFFYEGISASELTLSSMDLPPTLSKSTVKEASFGDQTLSMGCALLTFAGEAKLLKAKGFSPEPAEKLLRVLLAAFDELDAADVVVYGASKPGFFVRDNIHNGARRGVPDNWNIKSDMNSVLSGGSPKSDLAMSLDQATSLFVGWWAVTQWSTDDANREKARDQIDRVIRFLMASEFFVKLPDGNSIPTNRGPEFRYAAGFLCKIAERSTGTNYYKDATIDVTIKGDPIKLRDDNLGDLGEIPGYKIPASLPVWLSHPALLTLKPVGLVALTAPPGVKIRFTDLFPHANTQITLPCGHLVQAHPGGHDNHVPCVHIIPKHPGGDDGPNIPCTHLVPSHADGDTAPCLHMTAAHPGGDDGPTLPCTHFKTEHDHDTKKVGPVKFDIPCTHFVKEHPDGHPTKIPCIHIVPAHPGGHTIPCVHLTAKHPTGDPTTVPCIHPQQQHPEGDVINLPCAHIVQAHPSGHGFDLKKLNLNIPLGEKISPYARHIILQCLAFESSVDGISEFLPEAINSNHVWSALLRSSAIGDLPAALIQVKAKADHDSIPNVDGPNNKVSGQWTRNNRWEKCTNLNPDDGGPIAYNGLDFLSLEILMLLNK